MGAPVIQWRQVIWPDQMSGVLGRNWVTHKPQSSGEVGTMGLGLRKAWLRVTGMLVAHLGKGLP